MMRNDRRGVLVRRSAVGEQQFRVLTVIVARASRIRLWPCAVQAVTELATPGLAADRHHLAHTSAAETLHWAVDPPGMGMPVALDVNWRPPSGTPRRIRRPALPRGPVLRFAGC